jgi:hypothetical protein
MVPGAREHTGAIGLVERASHKGRASPFDSRSALVLVATPGALDALTRTGENPLRYLARHATGDWGDVGADDHAANDRALVDGERLLSAYRLADGTRIWIITEADRSVSTLLLPEEY